jgi:hypothetical protein
MDATIRMSFANGHGAEAEQPMYDFQIKADGQPKVEAGGSHLSMKAAFASEVRKADRQLTATSGTR